MISQTVQIELPGMLLARACVQALDEARELITDPPRLQGGFFHLATGIAVVYDAEADLVTTVCKPEEGASFFQRQIAAVKIDREGWQV